MFCAIGSQTQATTEVGQQRAPTWNPFARGKLKFRGVLMGSTAGTGPVPLDVCLSPNNRFAIRRAGLWNTELSLNRHQKRCKTLPFG